MSGETLETNQLRKIIHIDMDAFYASVEQRDNPALRGKPLAVGGSAERGVVAAASYEARQYGVKSAMPSKIAASRCPQLIFVRPRFEAYKAVSQQIRSIFYDYTDLVEPLSLDEAFLDVTSNKKGMLSATRIAVEIRKRIYEETELTASAGISLNKFLAKTASDVKKPNGLFLIPPDQAEGFVEKMPIEKFFGIGKVTAEKMHKMGISTGSDLKKWTELSLVDRFGKSGYYYYKIARAIDNRNVNPNRIQKSLGAENTFSSDLMNYESVRKELVEISEVLHRRMAKSKTVGRTLTVKVKYTDFRMVTRSKTMDKWIENIEQIQSLYEELLLAIPIENGIRLLGLSLSNLNHEEQEDEQPKLLQMTLEF